MATVLLPTKLTLKLEIPIKRLQDLLCGAFEGGSNYWYRIKRKHAPDGDPATWPNRNSTDTVYPHIDYPSNPGGYLEICPDDEPSKICKLDLAAMERGLEPFVKVANGRHFADFMAGNDDAETADVYLQCCLFGEIVYG